MVNTAEKRAQRGAVAIEFAIIFPLFLLIFYAIISYSLLFVYKQGLHTLSADAVRQAIAVERTSEGELDQAAITGVVGDFIDSDDASWPTGLAELCGGGGVDVDAASDTVSVCVEATLDLPQIDFNPLGIGVVIPGFTTVTSSSSIHL